MLIQYQIIYGTFGLIGSVMGIIDEQ